MNARGETSVFASSTWPPIAERIVEIVRASADFDDFKQRLAAAFGSVEADIRAQRRFSQPQVREPRGDR
jgi:hypothetical protein